MKLTEVEGKLKATKTKLEETWDKLEDEKARAFILEKSLEDLKVKSAKEKVATTEATMQDFKASKAFKESMAKFHINGFEVFRQRSSRKFPNKDFSLFSPEDDTRLVSKDVRSTANEEDDVGSK